MLAKSNHSAGQVHRINRRFPALVLLPLLVFPASSAWAGESNIPAELDRPSTYKASANKIDSHKIRPGKIATDELHGLAEAPIRIAASNERQAFKKAQRINTLAEWNRFLSKFPAGRLSDLARDERDALRAASPAPSVPNERQAFRKAQRINTIAEWDRFLSQFPSGRLANLARDERAALIAASPAPAVPNQRQAFRKAQRINTIAEWDRFLSQFPTGRLANLARDERAALIAASPAPTVPNRRQAFRKAQRLNTIAAWDRFLSRFPNGRLADLARDARDDLIAAAPPPRPTRRDAFRAAQRVNTIAGWDGFLAQFPNGRLSDLARDARDDLIAAAPPPRPSRRDAFRAAQRVNTIAGWDGFLAQFPNGRLSDLARDARDDLIAAAPPPRPSRRDAFRAAQRINTIAEWDRFLARFPNGRLSDLARDARDDLIAAAAPVRPLTGKPASYWTQDGSLLGLVARGKRRAFVYASPGSHLSRNGVKPGMQLFQGINDQSFYTGTAYVYSQTCGKTGYDVAGPVQNSGRMVVLRGREPEFRSDCSISGYRAQRMVFEFQSKAN